MSIAAVPGYLGQDFRSASPGMRFGMYLAIWHRDWSKAKDPDWRSICKMNKGDQGDQALLKSLLGRQSALFASLPEQDSLYLPAKATAPFTTGLGNEHPLENGFAFLWPYGLPYLPGSGVKGVVRQAARELASGEWGETHGWSSNRRHTVKSGKTTLELSDLDLLFGLESADGGKEHFRGLLTFWDVIPEISGDLAVDVMTPHQKHYYQEGQPPHDSGQPIPITFLTVPPGSTFHFHVTCDTSRMRRIAPKLLEPVDGTPPWQALLAAAFGHAFDWLGFGAKTAVGYGAMEVDQRAARAAEEEAARKREERERATLSPEERQIADLRKQLEADRAADRKEAGGPLNEQRLKLLQAALEWEDPALRKQAASLLRETAKFLPWAKKRKKEIQEQLARLEGSS